jgi:hypothetical protein
MSATKPKRQCERRPGRVIRACRTLVADLRHWGPLAVGEIIDDWQLTFGADRGIGDEERPAKRKHRPAGENRGGNLP